MPDTVVNTKKTEMKKALPPQEFPVFMMFCKLGTCGSESEGIYTRFIREEVSPGLLGLSSYFQGCFQLVLMTISLKHYQHGSFSGCLVKTIVMCLDQERKMSGGGKPGGGVLSVHCFTVGETSSLRKSYVLAVMYSSGSRGGGKSQPLICCVISAKSLSISGLQSSHQ